MAKQESNEVNFDDFSIENMFMGNPINNSIEDEIEDEIIEPTIEPEADPEPIIEKKEDKSKSSSKEKDTEKEENENGEESEEVDFKPFVQAFHEKFGWEFDESTLEDNSLDGLINHFSNIVESNVDSLLEEKLSIGDGTLKKLYDFVSEGGDPKAFMEKYYNPLDYSALDLADDDHLQERVIRDLLSRQGYDNEEIDEKISTYKDASILEKEAETAKKKLFKIQEKEKETIVENQKKQNEENKNKVKAYWEDVKATIKSWDSVGNFPILEKDKSAFFDYLTKPDKNGVTQYQKELSEDKAASIKMAYIQFKKFNTASLKNAVESDVVKKVKNSLNKFNSANKSGKSNEVREQSASNFSDFKLPWS
jgi:hypothetical protein